LNFQVLDTPGVPAYQRIADAVCDAVKSKQISAGEKLPTESALSTEMKVNRMTVSRAYEYLQSQGIIRQKRGSGTYVAPGALQRVSRSVGRDVENLAIIIGESSPAKCPRQTMFLNSDILEGMGEVLGEREHHWTFHESLTQEALDGLTEADAVIYRVHKEIDMSVVRELLQRGIRLVSVMPSQPLSDCPLVDYDRNHSAALACRHLLECGYKRIGYLGRKFGERLSASPKFMGFVSVMHEAGLDFSVRHIRDVSSVPGRAYAAAREIIDTGDLPEAFFVDTDYKAMETIGALNDAGIRVPDDIGIVSYDDVPDAASFKPPLTSVRTPRREIGRRTAQMLLEWPDDGTSPDNILLKSELIMRSSTKRGEIELEG